ncbi:hypothetical protein OG946_17160 [Streptomyces sp. NBC_01808]|uniref:hypothetical protein n=1 Tax=Streptomyces sp. NBC_01808 TaxID=2975947 RepID=UPI002DDC4460|nr:hypothetical protein [Streptomyces sp. NBC_01808]WSA38944.1 hypothetical protein OG946_17160 [Streptomyces sp. NBC_01808]
MSDDARLVAVATAAAAVLVADMIKAGWSSTRELAAQIFRHGGEAEERRQLDRLDADQEQTGAIDPAVLRDRWQRRLITLVEDFPAAAADLSELASRGPAGEPGAVTQTATGNTGPTVQIGGDNVGQVDTGSGQ